MVRGLFCVKKIEIHKQSIMNIFKELNSKGITVIMATHEKAFFDIGNETIDMDLL